MTALKMNIQYKEISFEDSLTLSLGRWKECIHSVHAMIYAHWDSTVLKRYRPKAAIMMQVRFDGAIGFPGGEVDETLENLKPGDAQKVVADALRRELVEESNIHSVQPTATQYRFTHMNEEASKFHHFYCIKIPFSDYEEIEKNSINASEWGNEVFGIIRVPLFTMNERENDQRGFPLFLTNRFAGNAKDQFLAALKYEGIHFG